MKSLRNSSGLTLTELLVAASIASTIAGAMVTVLSLTAGRTTTGNQVAALNEDLKQAQDLISNEAQGASRIYGSDELTGKVSVTGTTAEYQPLMGFFVPNLATTDESDYLFRLIYLDSDAVADGTGYDYKGPRVLFFSQPGAIYGGTPSTVPPLPTTALPAGDVLSDYLSADTTVNKFVLDAGTQKAGLFLLQGLTPTSTDPQSILTLKTRITARN